MRILVTNDDGIFSEGIKLLVASLGRFADVVVVAPDREQSATGHSLTLHRPLRIRPVEDGWYAVDGTPTDCINLGVQWLMKDDPPDLVVSGINFGLNLGDDVTYSGTVSATFEGTLLGFPSIAFSQQVGEHFSFVAGAEFAGRLVEKLLATELPRDLLLNVNMPEGKLGGVRFTKLGRRTYAQTVVKKEDPRGRHYFWIAGTPEWQDEEGTDFSAISVRGWIGLAWLGVVTSTVMMLLWNTLLRHLEPVQVAICSNAQPAATAALAGALAAASYLHGSQDLGPLFWTGTVLRLP